MSKHQVVTTFSRRVILYDDSEGRSKPEHRIAPVEPQKHFEQWFASVIALFTVLAIAGVGWMVVFAGLLRLSQEVEAIAGRPPVGHNTAGVGPGQARHNNVPRQLSRV